MAQTITIGSCVSVHGLTVRSLDDGRVVVRVGDALYAGQPVNPMVTAPHA